MPKSISSFFHLNSKHRLTAITVMAVFSLILSLPMIRSGLAYDYGLGFWGPNGHDGIWHLSLIRHLINPLAIPLPSFSGQPLQNYHPFFDVLTAWASRLTLLPPSLWLFQIMPLLLSFFFLFLSFELALALTGKIKTAYYLIFLNTFANSFGWLVSFVRHGTLAGESMFWAAQSLSLQINPPFALSVVMLLALILILVKSKNYNLSKSWACLSVLLLALIPVTKAYAAVPAFGIFFFYALSALSKRIWRPALVLTVSLVLAILLFLVYNSSASGLIRFQPFWFIRSMLDSPDRLYFPKLSSFIHTLSSAGRLDLRLAAAYSLGLAIFLSGNFAWRLLGLLTIKISNNLWYKLFFFLGLVTTAIPLLFIQEGTSWNTIQFMYYSLIFGNILLAVFLTLIKPPYSLVLAPVIIISSLLASIPYFANYLGNPAPSGLPPSEINALKFLAAQPPGLVLTYPYDPYLKHGLATPIPLYAYETTSYVSAYSGQNVYLADEMNLDITGYDWQPRRQDSENFFRQQSEFGDRGFLVNHQINYIYLTGLQLSQTKLNTSKMYLDEIYNDQTTVIYRVQR